MTDPTRDRWSDATISWGIALMLALVAAVVVFDIKAILTLAAMRVEIFSAPLTWVLAWLGVG